MSVRSINPTGVYVVGPNGQLVTHPVHTSKGVDFPSDEEIAKRLKPGYRFATSAEVSEAVAAAKIEGHAAVTKLAELAAKRRGEKPVASSKA
jgi:hypothetical protein